MPNYTCYVCEKPILLKPNNPVVYNGFIDQDTNQICCNPCKKQHYVLKRQTEHNGKYSEFPLIKWINEL